MISRIIPALLACLPALPTTVSAETPDRLAIAAEQTEVKIAPRAPGRSFLVLPALDLRFRLEPRCGDGRQPHSVSLSVNDSRLTADVSRVAGDAPLELALKVPAAQLAPLALSGFCEVSADADAAQPTLTIPAALSAHAALRCVAGDEQRITYVSQPLNVTLICNRPAGERAPE